MIKFNLEYIEFEMPVKGHPSGDFRRQLNIMHLEYSRQKLVE